MNKQEDMVMSVDEFNTPRVIRDLSLINLKMVRLMLMEPGTFPDQPERGFGLVSRYRYMTYTDDELLRLQTDLKNHIETWMPYLNGVDVVLEVKNKVLNIGISANEVFYEYTYDGKSMRNVTLDDIGGADYASGILI